MPHEVRITRRLAAPPDEVYDAWTNPNSMMEWMIPLPGGRTRATLEPRVGRRFHIDMISEGKTYVRSRTVEPSWC